MKIVRRLLVVLHVFVGLGALFGGGATIMNPQEPFGITVESLKYSPFDNYLIPGIILFGVIGHGNIISALTFRLKSKFQGYISSVFSWALIIWIVVQCIMLKIIALPHIIYFIIGVIEAVLSIVILFEQHLFPTNIVLKLYKGMKKEM